MLFRSVLVEVRLNNTQPEHVLGYVNNHLKAQGWTIGETSRDALHAKPAYPPQPMNDPSMGRVPMYYAQGMPPQPPPRMINPPQPTSQGYAPPGMMGLPPSLRSGQPAPFRPPPPPPNNHSMPMMSAQMVNSPMPDEKIEITDAMIKNLHVLKNPDKMIDLLRLEPDIVQKLVLGLANQNKLSLVVHNIKVREIWVGNLLEETTEGDIRAAFSAYGEIENVEMFNKSNQNQIFAFLKYYKVSQAARAFENIDNLSETMRLSLRISYSDFSKRNSIVGDNPYLEDNLADLTPFVFMAYNSGVNLPKAKSLQRRLSEFGKVKGVLMKPSYNSNFKSIVIIEYESVDQAVKMRKHYFVNDRNGKKRYKLGSKDMDINILTKVPEFRKFGITSQMVKLPQSSSKFIITKA